jgi:hypothetical protein
MSPKSNAVLAFADPVEGPVEPRPVVQPERNLTLADLQREIERLNAENKALAARKAASSGRVSFKVSEKGAISIYGMGRFPVTLYKSQFDALMEALPALQDFVKANEDKLAKKT